MTYFLHYNNALPLFVGGTHHGRKFDVPLDARYWRIATPMPFDLRKVQAWSFDEYKPLEPLRYETYRKERFAAQGRMFFIMIEEGLTTDGALMLMMQTVSEAPELRGQLRAAEDRIRRLEAELALLKDFIQQAIAHVQP